MPRPIEFTAALAAADADGICASQTPTVSGSLSLNGALVSGGVAELFATLYREGGAPLGRQVIITAAANETGRTFTLTGKDPWGNTISETLLGGDSVSVGGALAYAVVSDVVIDGAATGALTVGTNGVGWSGWVVPSREIDSAIAFACDVVGTINYDVEYTMGDPLRGAPSTPLLAFNHDTVIGAGAVAGKTADAAGTITAPIGGLRIAINSFTAPGSVTLRVQQNE